VSLVEYAVDMLCGTALLIASYPLHSWLPWSMGLFLILLSITHLDAPLSALIKVLIDKIAFRNNP